PRNLVDQWNLGGARYRHPDGDLGLSSLARVSPTEHLLQDSHGRRYLVQSGAPEYRTVAFTPGGRLVARALGPAPDGKDIGGVRFDLPPRPSSSPHLQAQASALARRLLDRQAWAPGIPGEEIWRGFALILQRHLTPELKAALKDGVRFH